MVTNKAKVSSKVMVVYQRRGIVATLSGQNAFIPNAITKNAPQPENPVQKSQRHFSQGVLTVS